MKRTCLLALLAWGSAVCGVDVIESGSGGTSLVVDIEAAEPVTAPGGTVFMTVEGAGTLLHPGSIALPCLRVYVPVPQGCSPRVAWEVLEMVPAEEDPAGRPLYRAPVLSGEGLETVETPGPEVPPPTERVRLQGVVPLAGCMFAALDIFPWLPSEPGRSISRIRIDVGWEGRFPDPGAPGLLAGALAPDGCAFWPVRREDGNDPGDFWGSPWARLSISSSGGYEVSCDDLEAAGCQVEGVPSASLRMFCGPGEEFPTAPDASHDLFEVAIEVQDGGDGTFDQGDRLRFLGRGLDRWTPYGIWAWMKRHRFASANVYWLTWGGSEGLRIQGIPGAPSGSLPEWGGVIPCFGWYEEESVWSPESDSETGWSWSVLSPGEEQGVQFSNPGLAAGASVVRAGFSSETGGDWTVEIRLGGSVIAQESGYGAGEFVVESEEVALPQSGVLTVVNSAGSDIEVLFDWLAVKYPRQSSQSAGVELLPGTHAIGRFNMTVGPAQQGSGVYLFDSFTAPVFLTGVEYGSGVARFSLAVEDTTRLLVMAPSDWLRPDSIASASPGRLVGTVTGADRLVIVPETLLDDAWGLVALMESRGAECEVATTREIYDEFGQGVADPGAIRSAVRWAMDSWNPACQGVVLVGDGHYDYLNHTTGRPVMIPPVELGGPGSPCFDDYYTMVHQGAEMPELPISRIPVDNGSELLSFVAKLASCESGEARGAWLDRALVIADDEWGGSSQNEAEHTIYAELISEEVLLRSVDRIKFYLIEYPWPVGQTHPEKPEAREDLVEELGDGQGYVLFFGHGSAGQITHEKIFLSGDVDRLDNGRRLPLTFWATCDVGHFDGTVEDAIAEKLLLLPAGGAIASIAATRGTYGPANYAFARAFTDSIYNGQNLSVGERLWLSKLLDGSAYVYNNRYYILFGDLDMPFYRPDGEVSVVVEADTLRTGEMNRLEGACDAAAGISLVELRESSQFVDYTCLGGYVITWLKYGGVSFRGSAAISGGTFELDCIVPCQTVTGVFGRASSRVPGPGWLLSGAADPVPVVSGSPGGGDYEGPETEMWMQGYEGIEHPVVSGEVVLCATLEDSSGICFLGGSGRQLTLFTDGQGADVGEWFSYDQGSTTRGGLEYPLGALQPGQHSLILWSFDGAGNSSRDTLMIESVASSGMSLSEALVYPNPGDGQRCFSFRISEDASVTLSIYSISGRCIRRIERPCSQGYNQIIWDGLDADGDRPASGAYIYSLEAVSMGSSVFENKAEHVDVLAIVRE